jgi:hypothetical protein
MTLLEDLDELSLLVPDAPTLTSELREAVLAFTEEAVHLLMDMATWRTAAAELADRLEAGLESLAEDAREIRTSIESGIDAVVGGFATALAELATRRGELAPAEDALEAAIRAAALAASSAAELVSSACEQAATAASEQSALFETHQQALRNAMAVTGCFFLIEDARRSTQTAIVESATAIANQLERLGPLAQGHLTDSDEAVQAHAAELCDAMVAVLDAYDTSAVEMASALFDPADEALIDVSEAAEAAEAATTTVAAAVAREGARLAQEGADFVVEQQTLEQRRDALVPYVEAAYLCREQMTGRA